MSEPVPATAPQVPRKKRRSRALDYAIIVVVIAGVIAAAVYQEQLRAFLALRMWDRDAPGRTVVNFLKAGRNGDRAAADGALAAREYQPLMKNGKWAGYFVVAQGGRMDMAFADLAPAGEPKATRIEFETLGDGYAIVSVPDAKGEPIKYRLDMTKDGWKITDIRGGRPAPQPPANRGGRGR